MEAEMIRERKPSIEIISNEGNRLDQFKTLFEALVRHNAGKFHDGCFCINTDVIVQPRNQTEYLFTQIQDRSRQKGIRINCFFVDIKPTNDKE